MTFGVHRNAYLFQNVVRNSTDWRANETTRQQEFLGRTTIHAFYAQDVVELHPAVKLTVGWRAEHFDTRDGSQAVRVTTCTAGGGAVCAPNGDGTFNKILAYPQRTLTGHSPKASLTWIANRHLLLRATPFCGRAIAPRRRRLPTSRTSIACGRRASSWSGRGATCWCAASASTRI
jgi:outer membrane receptor protein involved in Fe transport